MTVEFYQGGNPTPVHTFNVSTDINSDFEIPNLTPGMYTITVKNSHTLKRVKADVTLNAGMNGVDFGTMLEGDVNDNNLVNLLVFSILIGTYNKVSGDVGYDSRADLNNNGVVNLLDFSLLIGNYNVSGENP